MMRQVATRTRSSAAPGEHAPAFLGSSLLVTVPFPAVGSRSDRLRSAGGLAPEGATTSPAAGAGLTTSLPGRAAEGLHAATLSVVVTQEAITATEIVLPAAAAPPAAKSRPGDDVDPKLLKAVQRYLSRRSERSAPGAAERDCWDRFYREVDPLIRRMVRSWRLPDADTDDCVQEVWAELVAKLAGLDYDPRRGRFSSWLFTFVRRKVIGFLRRRSRHSSRNLADSTAMVAGHDDDPSTACQREEDRQMVRRMLTVLRTRVSDTNYRILHLRWIEGRSNAEIAAMVNVTQDHVRYRLQRAKRKFQALIAPHVAGNDGTEPS